MAITKVTGNELAAALHVPGPLVLDFYQATCPPCRVLEPHLERVAEEYEGRVPVLRVDIDRDLTAAERFGVMSLPTVLVLRDGKEMARLDGLITEAQLRDAFAQAAAESN